MKKQPNKGLVFSSLAIQIAIIMYAAVKGGTLLEASYELPHRLGTLGLSGIGLITVLWLIYKQSKRFWENE